MMFVAANVLGIRGSARLAARSHADHLYSLSTARRIFAPPRAIRSISRSIIPPTRARPIPALRAYAGARARIAAVLCRRVRMATCACAKIDPKRFTEEEDQARRRHAGGRAGGGDPIYFGLAGANAIDDKRTLPIPRSGARARPFLEYGVTRLIFELEHPDRTRMRADHIVAARSGAAANPQAGRRANRCSRPRWGGCSPCEKLPQSLRESRTPMCWRSSIRGRSAGAALSRSISSFCARAAPSSRSIRLRWWRRKRAPAPTRCRPRADRSRRLRRLSRCCRAGAWRCRKTSCSILSGALPVQALRPERADHAGAAAALLFSVPAAQLRPPRSDDSVA